MSLAPGVTTLYDQVQGPLTAGTDVTLPNSQTYTGAELQVTLNGLNLEPVGDYTYSGAGAPYSKVAFTFALLVSDVIDFRIIRGP
jgi:hypothetical protein